jgi:hypothetical protein
MLPLPYLPRIFGRQNNRNNVPARTPEDYYRRAVFLPSLDGILTQMHESTVLQPRSSSSIRLCGPLPKFAPNVSFRDIEEGFDHYAALLYHVSSRPYTSSLNFSSDVIKIRSAETKAKTETDCTEAEAETKTEIKTAKKRSRQLGLETNITEFQTWQTLCPAMDNPPCDCMSALLMCDKTFYPAIHSLLHAHFRNSTSIHSNSAERTFSALEYLKSYLRSSTSEERLTGLALAYIHLDIDVAVDISVDKTVDLTVDFFFATKQCKIVV